MNKMTSRANCIFRAVFIALSLSFTSMAAIAAAVVDINRADAATMIENWKGIGEKKAQAIVAYRKKHGAFADINDLAEVSGIGEGIIKNNRKYMSVSKGVSKPSGKSASTSKKDSKTTDSKTKSSKQKTKSATTKTSKETKAAKQSSKATTKKKSKSTSKKADCKAKPNSKGCKKAKKKKKKPTT